MRARAIGREPEANRWKVRLRYRDGRTMATRDRVATANWVAAVLPTEADVDPVSVLPLDGGWVVYLHLAAPAGADVVGRATALVEVVVGDAARVLGRLVQASVVPMAD